MKNKKNTSTMILGSLLIVVLLVISSIGIAQVSTISETEQQSFFEPSMQGTRASQHTVLGEVATATWCGYCPSMAYWISQVSGDFEYISLVTDKNAAASARSGELGTSGYPTAFFDGGYQSVVGGQSSVTQLQNAYNTCQARTVADVYPSVSAIYDENANTMDIIVFVDNQGGSTFTGQLRVYVVEKTSRWLDYDGDPYLNAMLGYAINTQVIIGSGQTFTDTRQDWSYPEMSMDNLMIVATVFDQNTNHAEQTVTAVPTLGGGGGENTPPPVITITSPDEGAIVNETITIEGTAHHPLGDGRLKWVFVKVHDGSWEQADGVVDWSFEWDTTSMWDGEYMIQAVSSDGTTQSGVDVITVTVKNNESEDPEELFSDLVCTGSLDWSEVTPGDTVEGTFFVKNDGDIGSLLNWEIESYPEWGEWYVTPDSGSDLGVEDGNQEITVLVTAPEEEETEFTGSLVLVNLDDDSDTYTVPITLVTPLEKESWLSVLLDQLMDLFPFLSLIFT